MDADSKVVNLFAIELKNPSATFTPGSTVEGCVKVSTTTILKTSRITLHALGRAHIVFSIIPDEVYFDYKILLWHGVGKSELPPGHYSFPFVFIIPQSCPPSFDGGFGSVGYSITAEIHIPWWFNKTKKVDFKVSPKLDLSLTPLLSKPVSLIVKKKGWFSSKTLRALVNIPRRVFTRNDRINLSVTLQNDRDTSIRTIESGILSIAKLAQGCFIGKWNFHVISCKSYASKDRVNMPSGSFSNFHKDIPLMQCLPTVKTSNLIAIHHYVYVKIESSGFFSSPILVTYPILINDNIIEEVETDSSGYSRIYPSLSGNSLAALAGGHSCYESSETLPLVGSFS